MSGGTASVVVVVVVGFGWVVVVGAGVVVDVVVVDPSVVEVVVGAGAVVVVVTNASVVVVVVSSTVVGEHAVAARAMARPRAGTSDRVGRVMGRPMERRTVCHRPGRRTSGSSVEQGTMRSVVPNTP